MSFWDDTFTGNNGDPPNPAKWTITAGTPTIQNNQLKLSVVGAGTQDQVYSKAVVVGDFDAQVDFTIIVDPASTASYRTDFIAHIDASHEALVAYQGDGSGVYFFLHGYNNGSGFSYNTASTTHQTSGKLRLTRSGTTFHSYYWNGASWVEIGTGHSVTGTELSLYFNCTNFNTFPNFSWAADNFLFNSGAPPDPLVFADSLLNWNDPVETSFRTFTSSDSLNNLSDPITVIRVPITPIPNTLTDSLSTPSDSLSIAINTEASFSYETFASLKDQLANKLHDPAKTYWTDTELGIYLTEAIRTFSFLTAYWRTQASFNTTVGTSLYDITSQLPTQLARTVTDRDLINTIECHFQEPITTNWPGGWTGTAMFTMDDIAHALQKRRNQFLSETGVVITHTVRDSGTPIGGRIVMTDNVIDIRRIARLNTI